MAPTSDKRLLQQQTHKQSTSQPSIAVLKDGGVSDIANFGEPQLFVHNALNQSHGHGHGHHNRHHGHGYHHHSKENASSRSSKKGLEILDFQESWREEMEIYKEFAKTHAPAKLMLGSHNHAHTPQGYKLDMVVNNVNVGANKLSHVTKQKQHNNSTEYAAHASKTSSEATGQPNNGNSHKDHTKRSITSDNKTKVRVATTMAEAEAGTLNDDNQRARVEATSKTGGYDAKTTRNGKRSDNSASPSNGNGLVSSVVRSSSPTKSPNASNNTSSLSASPSPTKTGTNKIIVNQFHASSYLNGHRFEKKEQILTQNGLTNTSATAYEASFYAANYLTSEARNNSNYMHNMNGSPRGNNNYIGVSLAQSDAYHNSNGKIEDDPCSAIDDVDTYSDTDSEEEYVGHPFYLHEDEKNQTKLSVKVDANKDCKDTSDAQSIYTTPSCILSPSLFPNVPPYLNFSSHSQTGPHMPVQLKKILKWKLSPVMPKIVKRVVLNSGFRIIKNTTDWMAVWEKHMKSPGFRTIRSHQKYNHMPGSFRIGRKDTMWRSIQQNMKKFGSKEFGFMQKSYVLPDDLENLRQVWPKNVSKLTKWIVKPPASARGTGISIVNKWSQFPKDRPLVVQKYIERPLLINDNKFDMRIYVVMTSVNPLRIYMYKDGLARFASVKYSSELNSLDQRCMHLTNYSINKFSENYAKNEDVNACQGHKWTLQSLWTCLESRGVNTKRLWATLRNLVIKAIISGESALNRTYRQNVNFRYNCFELFGFDVLLDENLIPWLLEINISPSLHSELPLDLHVKGPLIQTILNTALYQIPPKLNEKQQKDILQELNLQGPLCHDKRIFTTCLRAEEIRKHNHFTNRSVEYREEYLDAILDNLHPDDVRCLIVTEDELNRCSPLERIFPTPDTHEYLKFIEHPRYYNRLLDAWENRYGQCREKGIQLLCKLCEQNVHLQVADAALEKEPDVAVTEIDLLHTKKNEDPVDLLPVDVDSVDVDNTTKSNNTIKDDENNTITNDKSITNTITRDNESDTNNKSKVKIQPLRTNIKTIASAIKSKTDIKAS